MNVVTGNFSKPGKIKSEDVVGYSNGFMWLIDGATPPHNVNANLTYDYVNVLSSYIHLNSFSSDCIKELARVSINQAAHYIESRYGEFDETDYTPYATLIIVKIDEDCIEYVVIGDSYMVIETSDEILELSDDRLSNVAVDERDYLRELIENGVSDTSQEYLDARKRLIEVESGFKNVEGGYWVVGFDEHVLDHALTGCVKYRDWVKISLMSDGLARLSTHFTNCKSSHDIVDLVDKLGVLNVVNELRSIEKSGVGMIKHLSSSHDDASYISCVKYR